MWLWHNCDVKLQEKSMEDLYNVLNSKLRMRLENVTLLEMCFCESMFVKLEDDF